MHINEEYSLWLSRQVRMRLPDFCCPGRRSLRSQLDIVQLDQINYKK